MLEITPQRPSFKTFFGLILAVLVLLSGGSRFVFAQESSGEALLRGFVQDASNGQPLQGANVVLRDTTGAIEEAVATDEGGFYQVTNLNPGRYRLNISFVGYQTFRDTLQFSANVQRTVSVTLDPAPQELEEVTVEGRQLVEEAEAGLTQIRTADIETIPTPGPGSDLASYLRGLPGVTTTGDRGGRLYVRGGTPSQNLVLVNGLPLYKPFHILGFYSAFLSDLVSSTNFFAGGFGAEYTGQISSVLDVQLRPGNTNQYQGSVGGGPFLASAQVEGPLSGGNRSFLVSARHSLIEQSGPTLLGQDTPYKFYDVTGTVRVQGESNQCLFTTVQTYDRGRIDPSRDGSIRWSNTAVGGECLLFGGTSAQTLDVSFGTSHFNNTIRSRDGTQRAAGTWKIHTKVNVNQPAPWGGTFSWGGKWRPISMTSASRSRSWGYGPRTSFR